MALQKRFNDPKKQFVDPYWTIISGVLSHGRGRSKLTLDIGREMRRIWSPQPALGGEEVIWRYLRRASFLEVLVCDGRCSVRHCRGEV